MPQIDVSELQIPAAGQFFKVTRAINARFVEGLFDKVKEITGTRTLLGKAIYLPGQVLRKPYRYSFAAFKLTSPASFLKAPKLTEIKYGFVLIVEVDGYLGLFKKAVSGLEEELTKVSHLVGRTELINAYGEQAIYKKLSLRRMTISRYELEASSYEAQDLESSLPTLSVSRAVPRFIRLSKANVGSVSITPASARIHISGAKKDVKGAAELVLNVKKELEKNRSATFLDAFAMPITKAALPAGTSPTGILFDLTKLIEDSSGGEVQAFIQNGKNDPKIDVIEQLRQRLGENLLIAADGSDWKFGVKGKPRKLGTMKWEGERLSIVLSSTQKILIQVGGEKEKSLNRWVREENAFSVCFSNPEYFYTSGKLFRSNNLDAEIRLLKSILRPIAQLNTVTSEKGDWQGKQRTPYRTTDTAFRTDTTFDVLEKHIAKTDDHVLCADLGDEWADYIVLDKDCKTLCLCHCKAGKVSPGGSPFHIVVGQALKNLGRVHVRPDNLKQKVQDARQREYWGNTKIRLLRRRSDSWAALEQGIQSFLENPSGSYEVSLVVTMLSKKLFDAESAQQIKSPEFIQQVWLLTAFISACREKGSRPLIFCCD